MRRRVLAIVEGSASRTTGTCTRPVPTLVRRLAEVTD